MYNKYYMKRISLVLSDIHVYAIATKRDTNLVKIQLQIRHIIMRTTFVFER